MRLKNSFGNCSKCGKQIMWIKTKAGKSMPCNPSFVYYKEQKGGKDRIVLTNGEVAVGTVQDYPEHATGFGYKKGQIPQMDEFSFPADENLRKLAAKVCQEVNPEISVFEGRICSGDQFISDKGVKDAIISEFGGFAVEMEGAAIGQAAYLNHIPFLVVRAISDKADGSANMDYAEFEMAAIEHSVKLTVRMIQEL